MRMFLVLFFESFSKVQCGLTVAGAGSGFRLEFGVNLDEEALMIGG